MPDADKRAAQTLAQMPEIGAALKVATLPSGRPYAFDLRVEQNDEAAAAAFLGIKNLRNARLKGELRAEKGDGWRLVGRLTADVVQSCVATLDPVAQRIDVPVERAFVPEASISEIADLQLDVDADDDPDPYTDVIDLGAVMMEVLALSLDPYPRASDAEAQPSNAAPPGIAPLTDDDLKPFAGLAALRDKLAQDQG